MSLQFDRAAPILPSRDVRAALERYARLGFQTRPYLEPGISEPDAPIYGYLNLDGVEIHLTAYAALDPAHNMARCYVFVADADAVYASWRALGVEGQLHPPVDTNYGRREFGYVDPDGNLIRVGSPLHPNSDQGSAGQPSNAR